MGGRPALSDGRCGKVNHHLDSFQGFRGEHALLRIPLKRGGSFWAMGRPSECMHNMAFVKELLGQRLADEASCARDEPSLGFHSYLIVSVSFPRRSNHLNDPMFDLQHILLELASCWPRGRWPCPWGGDKVT